MTDIEKQPFDGQGNDAKRRSRWKSLIKRTEFLAAVFSTIATFIAGIGVNLISNYFTPRISTSVVVTFSIILGVAIIVYVAVYLYRRQVKIKLIAIKRLQEREQAFFKHVEVEISSLLSERVG